MRHTSQARNPKLVWRRRGAARKPGFALTDHVLMENRNGLVVEVTLSQATGTAERDVALDMWAGVPGLRRVTVGADKGYDTADFVTERGMMQVTPQVARRKTSKVDGRTTRHPGYKVSQRIRKRVEEVLGWVKTVGGGRKLRYRGVERNQLWWELTAAAYNLLRMAKLALSMPVQG